MSTMLSATLDQSNTVSENVIDQRKFGMPDQSKSIYSETLFSQGDEIFIQHQGAQYRLRRTRNGKLILTK
jgi:hemin uptake protein HemP